MEGHLAVSSAGKPNVNELIDIDIKCFDSPWEPERWAEITEGAEYGKIIAKWFGTPVGFAVYKNEDVHSLGILKVCVKKQMRGKGCSLRMLAEIFKRAVDTKLKEVFLVVPESWIYPGPANISNYLTHVGFVATKPILRNHFSVGFGEVEDGVKFVAPASTIIREPI